MSNHSSDGDFISIGAGTYSENITIDSKTLVITGVSASTTIIDGDESDSVFTLTHTVSNENIVITSLTIQNGSSTTEAGGIFVDVNGAQQLDLTLEDIIFKTNSNTNVNGTGGGLGYKNAGDLSLERVTFQSNSASRGAGLSVGSSVSSVYLSNVTFYENDATNGNLADGGAISLLSDALINNSTLAKNSAGSGGGIFIGGSATLTLTNTILYNQTGNNCAFADTGSITTDSNNLSSDASCTGLDAGSDDLISTDPLLKSALAQNGGEVPTLGLQKNSPAIDAGNSLSCDSFDARKEERPQDGDNDETAICDIGAYEVTCGDSIVDGFEDCDNGDANSDVLANACRTICSDPKCGDGVVDTDESCDDDNLINTDSCLNTCAASSCGDGFIQTGESCDDGDDNSDSLADACRTTCVEPSCGDGVIDDGEACDDGNANNTDECTNSCTENTQSDDEEVTATCGNSVIDENEECDDGNTTNADGCDNECLFEEFDELAISNPNSNFENIVIGQEVEINAPNPTSQDLDVTDFCDCLWNLTPSTIGSITDTTACESYLATGESGAGNLMVSVDCGELGSSTYNQTLVSYNENASSGGFLLSAPNGCQLYESSEESQILSFVILFLSLSFLFLLKKYLCNQY